MAKIKTTVIKIVFVLLCLFAVTEWSLGQKIFYVKENGAGDGSSWQNAIGDLQQAINLAADGDEIWVARGTYLPNRSIKTPEKVADPYDRSASFVINKNIKLYGGFIGNETRPSGQSTLSGNIGDPNAQEDNCYHVLVLSDKARNAKINGFLVKDGYSADITSVHGQEDILPDGTVVSRLHGAGIYIRGGSPQFDNMVVSGNYARIRGGGVYIEGQSDVIFNSV